MTKHFILIIFFFYNIYSYAQISDLGAAEMYFDNNFSKLDPLEGIYDLDIDITKPSVSSDRCDYSGATIYNYDKVIIYSDNGKLIVFSINKNKIIGYFSLRAQNEEGYIPKFRDYYYQVEGLNVNGIQEVDFDKIRTYQSDYFNIRVLMVEEDKIKSVFGYTRTNAVSINCNGKVDDIFAMMFVNFDVELRYSKVFPTKDYIPSPKVSYGTGFAIKMPNGKTGILTNFHVVEEYLLKKQNGSDFGLWVRIPNKLNEYFNYKAEYSAGNKQRDFAILTIVDPKFSGFPVIPYGISEDGSLGQSVFSLGYPLTNLMGNNIKLCSGMITGTTGIMDTEWQFTLDLNLNPGNSGGPLFNQKGDVVGIVSSRLKEQSSSQKIENVSYATKIKSCFEFSNDVAYHQGLAKNTISLLPLEEKIKKISPFIVQIKVKY